MTRKPGKPRAAKRKIQKRTDALAAWEKELLAGQTRLVSHIYRGALERALSPEQNFHWGPMSRPGDTVKVVLHSGVDTGSARR